jgi:chromosome partitioning protein
MNTGLKRRRRDGGSDIIVEYKILNTITMVNEVLSTLKEHFGTRVLSPIRANTKLREAPSHKQSIFDHDSHSYGARDYQRLADKVQHHDEKTGTRR